MYAVDVGIRCDDHAGEVFPPRCYECMALQAQRGSSRCAKHPAHFRPCSKGCDD